MLEDPRAQLVLRLGAAGGVRDPVCHACALDLDEARGRLHVSHGCAPILVDMSTLALTAGGEAETVIHDSGLAVGPGGSMDTRWTIRGEGSPRLETDGHDGGLARAEFLCYIDRVSFCSAYPKEVGIGW